MPNPAFKKLYMLVDCNNFYVACERLFRPDLRAQPALVLSSNDGCVVARSAEAKALGIARGVPFYQIRKLVSQHQICVFSANFSLYNDISRRIMTMLRRLCPHTEVYSIDEAFLICTAMSTAAAMDFAHKVRNSVFLGVGIPVSIGIAQTRTLAKLASHHAKSLTPGGGVWMLLDEYKRRVLLRRTPVSEVWGIGRQLGAKLGTQGITTAWELAEREGSKLRRQYSVTLQRTAAELNNIDCIVGNAHAEGQQQIMWSRTFRQRLTAQEELSEALCNYTVLAAEKLRKLGQYARCLSVSIRTSHYGDQPRYSAKRTLRFNHPTHDTRLLLEACELLLHQIYRPGFLYAKAGVQLTELCPGRAMQHNLFGRLPSDQELRRCDLLMATLDDVNRQHHGTLHLLAQGHLTRDGKFSRCDALSPAYTTSFAELPSVS